MEWINQIMEHFNRNRLLSTTKRVLNFAFVLVISNQIFQHFYSGKSIIYFVDIHSQFKFVAGGDFIAPLSIYIFTWAITNCIGTFGMAIFNYLISQNLKRKIRNISFNQIDVENINIQNRKDWFVLIYEYLKNYVPKQAYQSFVTDLEHRKIIYEADFIFIVRAIFALFLVTSETGDLDLFFSTIIVIVLLFYALITIIKLQFAELLPFAVQKISREMENYIAKKYPKQIVVNAQQDRLEN